MSTKSKAKGTTAERVCVRCGKERPSGRTRYCGDTCWQEVVGERERAKKLKRMAACARCGGDKEPGVRGSKYCAECRRVIGDSLSLREEERARRRRLAKVATAQAAGKRVSRRIKDAPPGKKWCARCQEFRAVSSFTSLARKGLAAYCRPCQRSYNQERRLFLVFGLTYEDYEKLLASQGDACALCGGKPRKKALAVDHDHQTGEIRGLLCSRCNHRLLGSAGDSPARLRQAADYLEEFAPRQILGGPRYASGFGPSASNPPPSRS